MKTSWYLVKVLPGKERQLTEQYNKEISLGTIKNILRFVCPLEKNLVVVKNKKVIREKVLYSGYLYFETQEKLNDDDLKVIAHQQSIMGLLGDKTPIHLRESDVARILKDDVLDEHIQSKKVTLNVTDIVTISDGAFNGFNGIVSAIKGDKVDVEVKVFGRGTIVTVGIEQVEKV
jgi:transcriptional antiterminator NusG